MQKNRRGQPAASWCYTRSIHYQACWSRADDVTILGGWGAYERGHGGLATVGAGDDKALRVNRATRAEEYNSLFLSYKETFLLITLVASARAVTGTYFMEQLANAMCKFSLSNLQSASSVRPRNGANTWETVEKAEPSSEITSKAAGFSNATPCANTG